MLDGGRAAVFTDRNPGKYVVLVAIAGNNGKVAQDLIEVELMEQSPPALPTPPAPAAVARPPPAEEMAHEQAAPAQPPKLILTWAARVNSNTRNLEARALAGSFRSVASQIATGALAPNADPLEVAYTQSRIALGSTASTAWSPFFVEIKRLTDTMHKQKLLESPQQWASFCTNMGAVLESVR
jgi:hypothetical protein